MTVDFHRVFPCIRTRCPHRQDQNLIERLLSIIDERISDTMRFRDIHSVTALRADECRHDRNRIWPADTYDSYTGFDGSRRQCTYCILSHLVSLQKSGQLSTIIILKLHLF